MSDDDVFCIESVRTVSNDYVVQYETRGLQLDRSARGRVPAKSKVLARETEDGRLRVAQVIGGNAYFAREALAGDTAALHDLAGDHESRGQRT